MSSPGWQQVLEDELARRSGVHQLRRRQVVRELDSTHVLVEGVVCLNFASNNYLGLSHHPRVQAAAAQALRQHAAGAGASPLVCGYTQEHAAAEAAIARWKNTPAAVLLPSGYQAAHAAVQTLAALGSLHPAGVRFLIDRLTHASLIDALGGRADWRVFPHNHLPKLQRLLDQAPPGQLQVVVTESIFSMDGDAADLTALAKLKEQRPFLLLLDEAHGSGVYGPHGAGYAAETGLAPAVDLTLVTFSKALGVSGAALCASQVLCDAVVNWGRAYIYSTALPPAICAAIVAGIDVLHQEPHRQQRLRKLARHVRGRLSQAGFTLPPGDSPIVPVILGQESAALHAAQRLREEGLLVVPIRPPTVPRGTSRLRITLSSEHTDEEVERLIAAVVQMRAAPNSL